VGRRKPLPTPAPQLGLSRRALGAFYSAVPAVAWLAARTEAPMELAMSIPENNNYNNINENLGACQYVVV
jgi:hypothetical protein